GRGRHDQAPRRRQVRRFLLCRLGRTARSRCLGRQCPVGSSRRRGHSRFEGPQDVLPRGVPGRFDDSSGTPSPDNPFEAFTEPTGLDVVGKAKRGATGTRVQYWADPQIFLAKAQFDYQHLVERARQTAFLVPGLELRIVDRRGVARDETGAVIAEREEVFKFDGGITEFVDHLAIDPPITDTWRLQNTGTFKETVPVLNSSGHL